MAAIPPDALDMSVQPRRVRAVEQLGHGDDGEFFGEGVAGVVEGGVHLAAPAFAQVMARGIIECPISRSCLSKRVAYFG